MKLLIIHNQYRHRGGEDICVENEVSLLRGSGMGVAVYTPQTPVGIPAYRSALTSAFGLSVEGEAEAFMRREMPDVLHVHNLFPLFSPRLFSVAKRMGIRVVQTLHNYRPICLNGLFMTPAGEVCERCAIHNTYFHGMTRGCYRDSRTASTLLATHLRWARTMGYYNLVDRYITPGSFLRDKFISYGWPAEKVVLQYHALPDFPEGDPVSPSPYLLYLGRFSKEKGVRWLTETFRKKEDPPYPLQMAGSGPMESEIKQALSPHIKVLGYLKSEQKEPVLIKAAALILASDCYENAPLAILEAQSLGVPVIAPRWGGFTEMIEPGVSGFLYTPGDEVSFWQVVMRLKSLSFEAQMKLRQSTHIFAKNRYAPSAFLLKRSSIYEEVLS